MSTEKSSGLSTSTAILIGSCVIAFALYMALKQGPAVPTPLPPTSDATAVVPVEPPKAVAPVIVAPPVVAPVVAPVADKNSVIRDASAILDKQKKVLTEKCLAPSLAKKPQPAKVKYMFNVTFDAMGNVVARGVSEDRETARPEVLACISENFPTLKVTPPGQSVLVDVPFELP
jgi:hypothetical protein